MRTWKVGLLCFLVLMLSGCFGKNYKVEVDSYSSAPIYTGMTYVLLPGNKGTTVDDLQFREYASYVAKALMSKGMRPADGNTPADLAIFVGYGISGPQVSSSTRSVPVWGQTGVSSSHTTGMLNTYGNYGTYQGTTTYTPQYGVTGYKQVTTTKTNYTRYLFLDAYDLKEYLRSKKEIQVWKTTITSTGETNDLRQAVPFLVAGSMEHLGTSTGKKVELKVREHSDEVEFIRGTSVR